MSQFPPEIYENGFFDKAGFVRKLCPSSKEHFWTLDPETVYSGVQEEVEYTFIGRDVFGDKYTVRELREKSLAWFAEQGHTPMASYPVLAKLWRNDLLFTSASICDFQPHVIERQLLPQANPLVVAQKCIRTNDLENIGRSGRHLSSFTMLGHHVFNFEGEELIYWIERTVELCHRFFTEALGADGQRITYVEAAWAGGGNAGPCLEVIYEGIEVATLVFMMLREVEDGPYDIKGVKYEEMPTKVVDTGYGVERIVWASQGTPNIYVAVSPKFVETVREAAGIELQGEILDGYFRIMSGKDIETPKDYDKAQEEIAGKLGITRKELTAAIKPVETIYALCDFTRTLLLMLNDHVLPSNKDAGYMTRHLSKRIIALLETSGIALTASEVVGMQFDGLVEDFPELTGKRETVVDIVKAEEERHDQTMARGRGQLSKEIAKLVKKKKRSFPEERVFFYYDSLGMPVDELMAQVREESELDVDISDNFYDKFFGKSMALDKGSKGPSMPAALPNTAKLYYEDPYATATDAVVTGVHGDWVALDKTIFYPDGGGQPGDTGTIRVDGSSFEVVDTKIFHNTIFHKLSEPADADLVGAEVGLEIDWARRYGLMRNHSATHVLNATLKKILGFHVRQMGAQKGVEASRFDIAHYRTITPQLLADIEGEINEIIFSGAPISTEVMARGKAEAKHGFFIYQGGFVPFDELRIVSVGQDSDLIDIEACAGTHLKDIREASLFKFLGASQIQNNVYRLRYSVGDQALAQFQSAESTLSEVTTLLKSSRDVAVQKVTGLIEENKKQGKALANYESTLIELSANAAREAGEGPTLYAFKSPVPRDNAMSHVIRRTRTDKNQAYFVVFDQGAVFMRSRDLGQLNLRDAAAKFEGYDIQRATPDMILFGGQIEFGAGRDIVRKILAG